MNHTLATKPWHQIFHIWCHCMLLWHQLWYHSTKSTPLARGKVIVNSVVIVIVMDTKNHQISRNRRWTECSMPPNVTRFDKRGTSRKTQNFGIFKVSPFQDSKCLGFSSWFISSSGLVLHKSNVRRPDTVPGLSGRALKWGIKRWF